MIMKRSAKMDVTYVGLILVTLFTGCFGEQRASMFGNHIVSPNINFPKRHINTIYFITHISFC